jgi:inositol hexakisphosphate/diphosphoinositol-pentakisphosphate kinase
MCRYGTDPAGKLAIGSKIATELLAKLLDDLRASKEESLATLTGAGQGLGFIAVLSSFDV